jgi:phosphatidylglycerophosphatase A
MSISVDLYPPQRHPTWRFMLSSPLHLIALGFGSGLTRLAPGTFGTVFGCLLFWMLDPYLPQLTWIILLFGAFVLGCWACHVTGQRLGCSDHGAIVWDEVVAMCLVLYVLPKIWIVQLCGFLVFRAIDIIKPPPIRYFDKKWKNGFGVMFDDLLAAGITLFLIAVYFRVTSLSVVV